MKSDGRNLNDGLGIKTQFDHSSILQMTWDDLCIETATKPNWNRTCAKLIGDGLCFDGFSMINAKMCRSQARSRCISSTTGTDQVGDCDRAKVSTSHPTMRSYNLGPSFCRTYLAQFFTNFNLRILTEWHRGLMTNFTIRLTLVSSSFSQWPKIQHTHIWVYMIAS